MKPGRIMMGAIAIGVAGTMVPVLNSCSSAPATLVAPPVIPGATFVGNKACAECRSEEHTSELQSLRHLVCRLLLEKKQNMQAGRNPTGLTHPLLDAHTTLARS